MNFDPTIGLGSVITLVVLGAGIIGTWATFGFRLDDVADRMKKGDVQHEQNQSRMGRSSCRSPRTVSSSTTFAASRIA